MRLLLLNQFYPPDVAPTGQVLHDLARALERLADDAALREALGRSARARVVERYSWARHCEQLDRLLRRIAG